MALTPASWRVFRRRFLIACVAAAVAMVSSVVVLNLKINDTIAGAKKVPNLTFPEGPAQGGNYLIIGSDSRAFVQDDIQAEAFGTAAEEGGQRADVMMVLHIDPEKKSNLLVSFPRDLLVPIPGTGRTGQINGVLNDGPQAVIDLMKTDFDVDINHYVQVDFQAFIGVVDAIGEIAVYFPEPARDKFTGLNITGAGCTRLDGDSALAYVRSRHMQVLRDGSWRDGSPRGDLDRIQRQQDFIRKLAAAASAKAGQNPLDAIDIANAIVPNLALDDQLGKEDILRLVRTFRNVDPEQAGALEMETLPNMASTTDSGQLEVKQPEAEQVLARLRTFGGEQAAQRKVRPTDVVVSVENGTDRNGEAGKSLAQLQLRGFGPGSVSTVQATPSTLVRYKVGGLPQAQLVAKYLGGVGQLIEDPSITDVDVVVVIGADWRGVHGKNQKVKGPATTTTTAAKSKTSSTTGTGASEAPSC